jgi:hypothetical protein
MQACSESGGAHIGPSDVRRAEGVPAKKQMQFRDASLGFEFLQQQQPAD